MKKVLIYSGIVIVLSAATAGLYWWTYFSFTPPNPEELVSKALLAADMNEKISATTALCAMKDPNPLPYLRDILGQSTDPEVVAQALSGMTVHLDHESIPLFIGYLDHASPAVRQAAYSGLLRLYGGELPDNIIYKPDAPAAERVKAANKLQKLYKEFKSRPLTKV